MNEDEQYEEEMETHCDACEGTGISPTGRVEDSCGNCGGKGYNPAEIDEEEPDDFEDCDSYAAEKIMWAGQEY